MLERLRVGVLILFKSFSGRMCMCIGVNLSFKCTLLQFSSIQTYSDVPRMYFWTIYPNCVPEFINNFELEQSLLLLSSVLFSINYNGLKLKKFVNVQCEMRSNYSISSLFIDTIQCRIIVFFLLLFVLFVSTLQLDSKEFQRNREYSQLPFIFT